MFCLSLFGLLQQDTMDKQQTRIAHNPEPGKSRIVVVADLLLGDGFLVYRLCLFAVSSHGVRG